MNVIHIFQEEKIELALLSETLSKCKHQPVCTFTKCITSQAAYLFYAFAISKPFTFTSVS